MLFTFLKKIVGTGNCSDVIATEYDYVGVCAKGYSRNCIDICMCLFV